MFARADGSTGLSVTTDGDTLADSDDSITDRKCLEMSALDGDCPEMSSSEGDGTRTRNLRIDSPTPDIVKQGLTAEFAREFAHDDPDLTELVDRWPDLDEPIKAVILALIKTTKSNHPTRNDKEESGPRSL